MPTYQYECRDCHQQFERFQKFIDDPLTVCPTCEGTVRRVIQNVGVVFKGSGWYINDSRPSSSEKKDVDKSAGGEATPEKQSVPDSESTAKVKKPKESAKAESAPAPASAAAPSNS